MTFLSSGQVNYRARLNRAKTLAERFPFASQILGFYSAVASFQQEFYQALPNLWGKQTISPLGSEPRPDLNHSLVIRPFQKLLSLMEKEAPQPLAEQAKTARLQGESFQAGLLDRFWKASAQTDGDASSAFDDLFCRVVLQPYAEFIGGAMLPTGQLMTSSRCPRCNSLPLVGVLRPEGDGGKRLLFCSLCSMEWDFRRILCAWCGEEAEQKLPVYLAEELPHIRVECCESCKHYLRTIDLTKDGHAIPIVDDLAAVPLTLWANEQGYTRIQSNLLGT